MLLLDTHAFVWLSSDRKQLSKKALATIGSNPGRLYLSSITSLEIALLHQRNRLVLPFPAREYLRMNIEHYRIQEIPVDTTIACTSAQLPDVHRDPFDRIMIATAMEHRLSIVSKDDRLSAYNRAEIIW